MRRKPITYVSLYRRNLRQPIVITAIQMKTAAAAVSIMTASAAQCTSQNKYDSSWMLRKILNALQFSV